MQAGMANPAQPWSASLPPLGLSHPAKSARYQSPPIGSWAWSHPKNTAVNAEPLSRSWVGFRYRQEPTHHLPQASRLPLFACSCPRVGGDGLSAHQSGYPCSKSSEARAAVPKCLSALVLCRRVWYYSIVAEQAC